MKRFAVMFCILFLFSSAFAVSASALELEYYGIEATIDEDMVVSNSITFKFDSPVTHMDYNLGFRVYNLTWSSNFPFTSCRINEGEAGNSISCDFTGMEKNKNTMTLKFKTDEGIEKISNKYRFAVNYGISVPVKRVFTIVQLPKNGILSEPVANESYYPSTGKTTTDGKHIMVYWNIENITQTDNLEFSVLYIMPGIIDNISNYIIVVLTVIVIATMIGIAVYIRKTSAPKTTEGEMDVIASVLNREERKVIDILKKHGGSTGQKIIVREADFSKAKVSRLVKNLKERGIVDTEPISGRENRIILKKMKPGKPEETETASEQSA